MKDVNWTKVGVVGSIIAVATGGVLGNMLSDGQADQVLAWSDAAKGALMAVVGAIGAFTATLIAARKKG